MHDSFKLAATGIIWMVVLLLLGSALWVPIVGGIEMSSGSLMFMTAFLSGMAAIATGYVWRSGQAASAVSGTLNAGAEKVKRMTTDPRERLMRTLSALDDEEATAMLDDLKARLHGGDSDGEISAVEMLRQERRHA